MMLTKKTAFEALLNTLSDSEENVTYRREDGCIVEVDRASLRVLLQHEIAQLEKRAAAPKKPSKSQQENVTHKANLLAALAAADAPMGIADLRDAVEGDLTPNKVSALMGQLVTEGKAARIPGRGKDRKVTFTLA